LQKSPPFLEQGVDEESPINSNSRFGRVLHDFIAPKIRLELLILLGAKTSMS
jgi:hypothetical protein